MSSSNPTSAEEGKETLNSDPVHVSNDKSSAEKSKGKKRSRDQTQGATEAKGEVDSQSVDEPEATGGTSSSASTSKKWTKTAINYLQAENEKLKQALVVAKRIRKKDKPAYHKPSSEEENHGEPSTTTTQIPTGSTTMSTPKMTSPLWGAVDRVESRDRHQHLALVCWVSPTIGW